ncbi:polyprenyl synthetase family protein [Streptomyces sp. NPDC085479]|uniref:polyprenyl synthetase family protein n=1 Tax=Streptomyces sp. NPDC085479 TaxID=3365726 RepID=UPI0037CF4294
MSETATSPPANFLDPACVRREVDECLAVFLDAKAHWAVAQGFPPEVADVLRALVLGGGKRIRPVVCVAGWLAAGGYGDRAPVVRVAASLEMFHAFALVHDDVMDRSVTRRGRPSAHEALAARHRGRPDAAQLGMNAAVLLGDLALAWSDELFHTAGLSADRFTAATAVLDQMRTELMYGQYLDLLATGEPSTDVDASLRIARFKSAKYTVEHPLRLGAVLAGADTRVGAALSRFGVPLGEAFQLCDDLLSAFGDPVETGKPVAEDLREGKHTALLAVALRRATETERDALTGHSREADFGPGHVARIRVVLEGTGVRRLQPVARQRRGRRQQAAPPRPGRADHPAGRAPPVLVHDAAVHTQDFQRRLPRTTTYAWYMSTFQDAMWARHHAARATFRDRAISWYVHRLYRAAVQDPKITKKFLQVSQRALPPTALLSPRVIARICRSG